MGSQIRWGILSTGTIAHNFARTVRQMNGEVLIAAVASRSEEKAKKFAEEYGIEKAYGSYEAMAEDPTVDVIYIGTPHSHHYDNIRLCLNHGKHVLCEKSFTVTAAQARETYRLTEEKHLFLMEGFWTKFFPVYRELEELLTQGAVGEIHLVTAQYGYCTAPERAVRKFDPVLAGGTLLDIGVYAIGFAAMVLGYSPEKIVSLVKKNTVGTDSYSVIAMQYKDGAMAQLTTAIQTTIPVMAAIYGSAGYIEIPEFKNPDRIRVVPNTGDAYEIVRPHEINGFEYEIREVQKCIENGQTTSSRMTPAQSIAVMEIMDEVRKIWNMEFPLGIENLRR